jgi:hypothetical protein
MRRLRRGTTHSLCVATTCFAAFACWLTGAAAQKNNGALLTHFCAPGDIKGSNCLRAKDYPNGDACNVDLGEETPIEGRFISPGIVTVLVRYGSDCEAHATENGGSVVFERTASGLRFLGYQPGLVFESCATVAAEEAQDRLVCITGHMGQGYLETGIAEVLFARKDKDLNTDLKYFQRATDSVGANGANAVKCKSKFAWLGFSNAKPGPGPATVLVEAEYADADAIRRACARNAPKTKASAPAPTGEAFIRDSDIRKARFVLDLASRALMAEANYIPK